MFFKTLNEFKQNKKQIKMNEGGGAGISFETEITLNISCKLSKDNLEIISQSIDCEKFSAKGYDDGMIDIDCSKLIDWTIPTLTKEMLFTLKTDDQITLGEYLSQPENDFINIELYCTYEYKCMHFGGQMRGKLEQGDIIFSQELNRNKELSISYDEITTNDVEIDNYDNQDFQAQLAPVGKGKEDFNYFWQDVFEYDNLEDAKALAYQEIIFYDIYDSDLEEYMLNNDITMSLEEYKKQLKEIEGDNLPDDLYDFLQKEKDLETRANDSHQEDAEANWGV